MSLLPSSKLQLGKSSQWFSFSYFALQYPNLSVFSILFSLDIHIEKISMSLFIRMYFNWFVFILRFRSQKQTLNHLFCTHLTLHTVVMSPLLALAGTCTQLSLGRFFLFFGPALLYITASSSYFTCYDGPSHTNTAPSMSSCGSLL